MGEGPRTAGHDPHPGGERVLLCWLQRGYPACDQEGLRIRPHRECRYRGLQPRIPQRHARRDAAPPTGGLYRPHGVPARGWPGSKHRSDLSKFLAHSPFVRSVQALPCAGSPASGDQEKEVESLNGVCVLCRVEALREIGLLDEDMGGYVEDTDWAWRARDRGWDQCLRAGGEHRSITSRWAATSTTR